MMTLTEFLLARIAEDEESPGCNGEGEYWSCSVRSERAPCEAAAKRRIVEAVSETLALEGSGFPNDDTGYTEAHWLGTFTLRALAAVYADHGEFQEEWKP